jgi:hypothetical protein
MIDWKQLADGTVLPTSELHRVAAAWQGRESTSFEQDVRFFDFESNGKPFTQVATVYTPAEPLIVKGKRVVVVASEGGHDNGREFAIDDLRREGPAPWLAKRGITFVALSRLGRWNFLTDKPLGSWADVPLDKRMPMFHRGQKAHWPDSEYAVIGAEGVSSPTGSQYCRMPRPGSDLEAHMMALTPTTAMKGFREALAGIDELKDRHRALLLYWGFSTGGSFLWAFAKQMPPDGVMGFGMSSFPIAHFATRAANNDHRWLYDPSAFRLRERGMKDFAFFSPDLSPVERDQQFAEALNSPRFKSFEDTFMFFNVAAGAEAIARLWNADFLPADIRQRGFSALMQENLDLAFPDDSLAGVSALDLSGTRDEIQPPEIVLGAASVVRPHCRRYKVVLLEGLHHSIAADQAPVFCGLWLDAIESGYFEP